MDKPVDMKLTKADIKDRTANTPIAVGESDGPKYPWGLEIRLDKTSLKKLGMTDELPEVGVLCQLTATARVTSVSERQSQSGEESCDVSIQIERMTLAVEGDESEDAFASGAKKGRGRDY